MQRIADRQRGLVTVAQLAAAGVGRGGVRRRVEAGRLHRVHRGVYVVGHTALAPLAKEQAALLACGPHAVLSHHTAAALWGLGLPRPIVDVTVPRRTTRRHRGINLHRPLALDARAIRRRHGLPLTAPARTVVDLAPHLSATDLERLVAETLVRQLAREGELRANARIERLLGDGPRLTRSEAERRVLELIDRAGLPRPRTNQRIAGHEVDLVWPELKLVVEVDGYAFHGHRIAFEDDHRRDLTLHRAGYVTIRITWRQIEREPEAVIAALATACALRREPP